MSNDSILVGYSARPRFEVGDDVIMREDLYEHADEYQPGGYLARKGDRLVVRNNAIDYTIPWTNPLGISVSHQDRTDGNTFLVYNDEIYHHIVEFMVTTHHIPWKISLKMPDDNFLQFDVDDMFIMDDSVKSIYDLSTAKINMECVGSLLSKHEKYKDDILEFITCKKKHMSGVIHCPYVPENLEINENDMKLLRVKNYKDTSNVK